MKVRDLKIGRQLGFGLGTVLLLVLVLGAVSWYQATRLWEETRGMYEHPLQVRRAMGEIRVDILSIAMEARELLLADSEAEQEEIIRDIDKFDTDSEKWIELLYDRYLGPATDIDSVRYYLDRWRSVRNETIRLVRAGRLTEAEHRIKTTGIQGEFIARMMTSIDRISDFQIARGDKFYNDALTHKQALLSRLIILVLIIVLLTLAISSILLRNIRNPVSRLLKAATDFQTGDLDARCGYRSRNEFGELSAAFDRLAEIIGAEARRKSANSAVAEVMLREVKLKAFSHELLSELIRVTGAQVAALYLLDEAGTTYVHYHSIGLSADRLPSFSSTGLEGEFGRAITSGKISYIKKIPKDSFFAFKTVSGEVVPREIATLPILSENSVVAVISLASVRSFSSEATTLIDDVYNTLSARLNGVLLYEKLENAHALLQYQHAELDAQRTELTQQKDELNEQNTELAQQKRKLDEAARFRDEFLSRMSHELRTPLNSVLSLTGVLIRRLKGTISGEEFNYLEVISRNGKQLLSMINDILDLSRINSGKEEINCMRFAVGELISDVTAVLKPTADEKEIELKVTVQEGIPDIVTDYEKCVHVLQNLVGNAIKFTDEGSVSIVVSRAGDWLQITVNDTGIGIEADQIPYIFDEFRQSDESWSRKYGGTGLGLAIVRKYTGLLQGTITVESTPGKGSSFRLLLPLKPGVPDQASAGMEKIRRGKKAPRKARVSGKGKNILLVEDSEPSIIQIRDILEQEGFSVRVARNGREALQEVAARLPDAMVLDLMMPEMDGFDVLRLVRSAPGISHLPVLILTAKYLTAEELSFLRGNNVHQLIQKGDVRRDELLDAIAGMVSPPEEEETD